MAGEAVTQAMRMHVYREPCAYGQIGQLLLHDPWGNARPAYAQEQGGLGVRRYRGPALELMTVPQPVAQGVNSLGA